MKNSFELVPPTRFWNFLETRGYDRENRVRQHLVFSALMLGWNCINFGTAYALLLLE